MENASKALLMAAGVLIGILVLTLAVYLFITFGVEAKKSYDLMEEQQLVQYNSQYTIYTGRDDITIYDIVSVANLAKENNKKYEVTDVNSDYYVSVKFKGVSLENKSQEELDKYILDNYWTNNQAKTFKCVGDNAIVYKNGRVKAIYFTD